MSRILWLLLIVSLEAVGYQKPLWTGNYSLDRTDSCVGYAREIAEKASKDGRQVYFIVGFTKDGRPHVFVVVDGWALDNGAIEPRIFPEKDVKKYMRQWWIYTGTLPEKATLRIVDPERYKEDQQSEHQEVHQSD